MGGKGKSFFLTTWDVPISTFRPSRQEGYCMSMVEAMALVKANYCLTNFLQHPKKVFSKSLGHDGLIAEVSKPIFLYEYKKNVRCTKHLKNDISQRAIYKKNWILKRKLKKFFSYAIRFDNKQVIWNSKGVGNLDEKKLFSLSDAWLQCGTEANALIKLINTIEKLWYYHHADQRKIKHCCHKINNKEN